MFELAPRTTDPADTRSSPAHRRRLPQPSNSSANGAHRVVISRSAQTALAPAVAISSAPHLEFILMRHIKSLTAIVATVMLVATLGCASTRTQESTGQYIDDSTITTRVKAGILGEPGLKVSEINVETFKGVVQLSGFVNSRRGHRVGRQGGQCRPGREVRQERHAAQVDDKARPSMIVAAIHGLASTSRQLPKQPAALATPGTAMHARECRRGLAGKPFEEGGCVGRVCEVVHRRSEPFARPENVSFRECDFAGASA